MSDDNGRLPSRSDLEERAKLGGSLVGTTPFDPDYLLPPGWLRDYVNIHKEVVRAPTSLMAWSIIVSFGALFGRRVRIMQGGQHPIDSTVSAVLVAPSGEGKGTSMSRAAETLNRAVPTFKVIGGKATMEGILARLDPNEARGLILAEELGAMFGQQKFRVNFDQEIIDLMDNKETYRWHTKGSADSDTGGELSRVAVALLAGTTKAWMDRCMVGTALEEGFASRVLWVLCVEPPRYLPFLPQEVPGYPDLVRRLHHLYRTVTALPCQKIPLGGTSATSSTPLTDVSGATPSAKKPSSTTPTSKSLSPHSWWQRWMEDHHRAGQNLDPWRRGWWNRKPPALLQLALVLAISESERTKGKVGLTTESLMYAERLLDYIEPGMRRVLTSIGSSETFLAYRRLLSILHEIGGRATTKELTKRAFHVKLRNVDIPGMLQELAEVGAVEQCIVMDSKRGAFGWTLTEVAREMLA